MERVDGHVLRADQPIAIELASTIHVSDGDVVDALAGTEGLRRWLDLNRDRLGDLGQVDERAAHATLHLLRDTVRRLLLTAATVAAPAASDIEALNATIRAAPSHAELRWVAGRGPEAVVVAPPDPTAGLAALLARDCLDVLAGARGEVAACGAPSCVLLFVRTHPRQAWCSPACGNRARVARHYRRRRSG